MVLPSFSEVDVDELEWVEARNFKKEKQTARIQRKREEEEKRQREEREREKNIKNQREYKADETLPNETENSNYHYNERRSSTYSDEWTYDEEETQSPSAVKKSQTKRRKRAPSLPVVNTVADVIHHVRQLIENHSAIKGNATELVAEPSMPFSLLQDRFNKMINSTWNKRFKPRYGPMKNFIQENAKDFFEIRNDQIYVKPGRRASIMKSEQEISNTLQDIGQKLVNKVLPQKSNSNQNPNILTNTISNTNSNASAKANNTKSTESRHNPTARPAKPNQNTSEQTQSIKRRKSHPHVIAETNSHSLIYIISGALLVAVLFFGFFLTQKK